MEGFYRHRGIGRQEISFTGLSGVKQAHYDCWHMAEQTIVGFHRDAQGDWVAKLECGHGQHVRHRPPWEMRPWVVTPEGRREHLGKVLRCKKCDEDVLIRTSREG